MPQPPQLAMLVFVLTQVPLQGWVPAGHTHALPTQDVPPVQALPHPLQLALSAVVLTHVPLQLVGVAAGHAAEVQALA
jgi:hypothetical protein